MQISTPTQVISPSESNIPSENLHESGSTGIFAGPDGTSPAIWGGAGKKGKSGVFARLLEGLISKTKTLASEPNSGKPGNLEFSGAEKPEKSNLKASNLKKSFNLIANGEGEQLLSVADLALLRQSPGTEGKIQAEHGSKFRTSLKNVNLMQQNGEISPKKEISDLNPRQMEDSEIIPGLNSGKGRNSGLNKADFALWHNLKERTGSQGNADVTNLSFRDIEARFALSQTQVNQRNSGGEKENSRLAESKDRKNRFNINVRDLRTGTDQAQAAGEVQKQIVTVARPVSAEVEIPVNLNLSGGKGGGDTSVKTSSEGSVSKGFEDALARELRSGLANDIVRDATVILRNHNEGTIRLSLRPASLGDVKVRLEMAENKITGYIIVENSEALRAFERELPVLEKAFKDSGFSETNLEMSLAQDQWNFNTGEGRQEGDFPSVSPVLAASRYEPETEQIEGPSIQDGIAFSASTGRTPVNLLV